MILIKSIVRCVESLLTWLVRVTAKDSFNDTRYRFNLPEVWYSPWREDRDFLSVYRKIVPHTLISERKLFDLFCLGKQVSHFQRGIVLEVGSYKGGSGALLASALPEMQLILWDNWGTPVVENDYFVEKVYATSSDLLHAQDLVSAVNSSSALTCKFVSDSFPNRQVIDSYAGEYVFVHFDIYDENAFDVGMSHIWPKLRVGGIIVCGGYGAISLDALTEVVNLFVKGRDCTFIQSQSGLGVIIKR